jgi:transposase InsO family protein
LRRVRGCGAPAGRPTLPPGGFSGDTFYCPSGRASCKAYAGEPFCLARLGDRRGCLVQGVPGLRQRKDDNTVRRRGGPHHGTQPPFLSHVDLVGPQPTSKHRGNYIFTVIDRSTQWAEAIPLSSTTADSCATALVRGWVSRFGVPAQITSDRGPQFAGAVWAAFCRQMGIKHVMTTAYHPQSNGMVERFHRQLKEALRARNCGADWADHLPRVLLGIRAAPKDDTGMSLAELVYGCGLVLPGELQVPSLPIRDRALAAPRPSPSHDTRLGSKWRQRDNGVERHPPPLEQAKFVYVRQGYCGKPLSPVYSGPYEVVRRAPKYFILRVGDDEQAFSVDRLKPYTGQQPAEPHLPPRRGRPAARSVAALRPVA